MAVDQLYSHEETVAAITSYYKLVSRAHAITTYSPLLYPPPGGWPQLTDPDVVTGLGFSDDALDLVRHIPYFENSDIFHIVPNVQPKSYIGELRLEAAANLGESVRNGESHQASNPHIVLLGYRAPGREYGHDIWLDTKLGNAIMGNYHGQVQPYIGDIAEDGNDPDPDDSSYDNLFYEYGQKGEYLYWRIGTFFAACERNLRELVWIPGMDEGDNGWLLDEHGDSYTILDYEHRKRIMRDNGWPGDSWNPDGVNEELDRLLAVDSDAESNAQDGQ
ncbi:hypothetical protein F5B20DRAFT_531518 [Whalleya microplaca]|nr:hypothetical protein F5B20DRAFT_531518 [Whalleya microplaca]